MAREATRSRGQWAGHCRISPAAQTLFQSITLSARGWPGPKSPAPGAEYPRGRCRFHGSPYDGDGSPDRLLGHHHGEHLDPDPLGEQEGRGRGGGTGRDGERQKLKQSGSIRQCPPREAVKRRLSDPKAGTCQFGLGSPFAGSRVCLSGVRPGSDAEREMLDHRSSSAQLFTK